MSRLNKLMLDFAMNRICLAIAAVACFAPCSLGDFWTFPEKVVTKNFDFGDTKVVLEIDGSQNRTYPPHTVSIYLKDKLVAKYQNVGFQKVFASPDNQFFVGLSNAGIPGTAFIVFDSNGNLIREVKHDFLPVSIYTNQSFVLTRHWYDPEKPVRFKTRRDSLKEVIVQGSNGQSYSLLRRDLGIPSGNRSDDPFAPDPVR